MPVLMIFFVLAVQAGESGNLETSRIGQYTFLAAAQDSLVVKYLADQVLIENEPVLQEAYNYSLRQNPVIILPRDDNDYFRLIGSAVPDWSGGVAVPEEGRIVLRPGIFFDPGEYQEVLLHELGHIYLSEKTDSLRVPLWFNEGLAMLVSGRTFNWNDHLVLGGAVMTGKLLDLPDVDAMLSFGLARARLAYAQSLIAVQLLINHNGRQVTGELLDGVAAGKNWDQVFEQVTASDAGQFNSALQQYIRQEYRWAWLWQAGDLFWIMLAVLFLCGFIMIKIRNRRIMKDWENDENDQ